MNRGMEVRKAPIYGNLTITDPSGKPMFRCGDNKFKWYIKKGLAELVDERTARLLFVPNGMGCQGDTYLMDAKNNVCVVCGCNDPLKLTKHHVVPHSYRTAFPPQFKNHNHFDILPVCRDCHDEYEHQYADPLKAALAKQYAAPLVNLEELKACKYANALCQYADQIPDERQREMLIAIETFLGRMPSASDLLDMAQRKVGITRLNETHGRMVVARLPDLEEFVKLWRKHFLDSMNPQFLPAHWHVDRPMTRQGAD